MFHILLCTNAYISHPRKAPPRREGMKLLHDTIQMPYCVC